MTFSSIFAQFVAILGGIALQWRKMTGTEAAPAWAIEYACAAALVAVINLALSVSKIA